MLKLSTKTGEDHCDLFNHYIENPLSGVVNEKFP